MRQILIKLIPIVVLFITNVCLSKELNRWPFYSPMKNKKVLVCCNEQGKMHEINRVLYDEYILRQKRLGLARYNKLLEKYPMCNTGSNKTTLIVIPGSGWLVCYVKRNMTLQRFIDGNGLYGRDIIINGIFITPEEYSKTLIKPYSEIFATGSKKKKPIELKEPATEKAPAGNEMSRKRLDLAFVAAKLIRKVKPRYTALALDENIQGKVVLIAYINKRGKVTKTKLIKGLGCGLDQEAQRAAKLWTYKPATLDGAVVKSEKKLTMKFRIEED